MADAFHEELFIEVQIGHEVDLVQENHIRFFKSERILVRLVAAVCHADDEELHVLADIQLGRADEISDIFDEEDARRIEIHGMYRIMHERCIQMAGAEGIDLRRLHMLLSEALGIDVGLDIPLDDIDLARDVLHELLERGGLARPRCAHDIHGENIPFRQVMSDMLGNVIVMGVDILHHASFDHMHGYLLFLTMQLAGK